MEHIHYDSFLILSVLAFLTPILIYSIKKVKIPYVVGEILVGIIIGKSFLNIIQNDPWIHFLGSLGLAYLLFLSGLEIDLDNFQFKKTSSKHGFNILMYCLGIFILSLIVAWLFAYRLYGPSVNPTLFFTILLASSAPGLLMPILREKSLLKTEYGQIMFIFSLVCEFVCLIGLTVTSQAIISGLSIKSFLFLLVFLLSFLIYRLMNKYKDQFNFTFDAFEGLHLRVRAAFALILVLVTVSDKVGTEIILGSFLAGLIFSAITKTNREKLLYKLDIIGYGFLIPIFFMMVGVNLDLRTVVDNPSALLKIPFYLVIFFSVKFIPFFTLVKKLGFFKSVGAGFLTASQLSLLIIGSQIAYNIKLIDIAEYTALIIATIISCIIFPMIFDHMQDVEFEIIKQTNRIRHKRRRRLR
jgi:Kef-type K+ transport system membrane component KefB